MVRDPSRLKNASLDHRETRVYVFRRFRRLENVFRIPHVKVATIRYGSSKKIKKNKIIRLNPVPSRLVRVALFCIRPTSSCATDRPKNSKRCVTPKRRRDRPEGTRVSFFVIILLYMRFSPLPIVIIRP